METSNPGIFVGAGTGSAGVRAGHGEGVASVGNPARIDT
jgi:hypothetical protein